MYINPLAIPQLLRDIKRNLTTLQLAELIARRILHAVDEDEIAAGVRLLAERSRLVVEPSGALAVAAATFRAREAGLTAIDGPVIALVSGGNVDPDRFRTCLEAPIPDPR